MKKPLPTIEEVRRHLAYDHATGSFTYACDRYGGRFKAGSPAGGKPNSNGYIVIGVGSHRRLYAHRLAWAHYHGEWPEVIDHINGDRTDNRISNLRSVSWSGNARNRQGAYRTNKSGYLGVVALPPKADGTPRFTAYIRAKDIHKSLGVFSDPVVAHNAYLQAKRDLHSVTP